MSISNEFVKVCRKMATHSPVSPPKNTRIGRMVYFTPIAQSKPWTGNGVWQSNQW